jgi:hypothetical protein
MANKLHTLLLGQTLFQKYENMCHVLYTHSSYIHIQVKCTTAIFLASRVHIKLGMVAHTYNPSHSRGRDQEDGNLKPAWANSSTDPISKKTQKGMVQWFNVKALSVNSSTEKKKKSSFQSQHIARLCN